MKDQAKEEKKEKEAREKEEHSIQVARHQQDDKQRAIQLMNDMQQRVNMLSEPNLELEPCNVVSVWGQNLGLVRHLFNSEMKIKRAYGWIGSWVTYPEYFHSKQFLGCQTHFYHQNAIMSICVNKFLL